MTSGEGPLVTLICQVAGALFPLQTPAGGIWAPVLRKSVINAPTPRLPTSAVDALSLRAAIWVRDIKAPNSQASLEDYPIVFFARKLYPGRKIYARRPFLEVKIEATWFQCTRDGNQKICESSKRHWGQMDVLNINWTYIHLILMFLVRYNKVELVTGWTCS